MLKPNYFNTVPGDLRLSNRRRAQLESGRGRLSTAPGGRAGGRGGGASIGRPRGITGVRPPSGAGARFPRTCTRAALPGALLEKGLLRLSGHHFPQPAALWKVDVLSVHAVLS